jgi:hypothetical protein
MLSYELSNSPQSSLLSPQHFYLITLSARANTFGGIVRSIKVEVRHVELDIRKSLHYNAIQRKKFVWNVN